MYLEVKQWPESQEVMGEPDWFFIQGISEGYNPIGDSAYARILTDKDLEELAETHFNIDKEN